MSKLTRSVYRSLLQLTRQIDHNPSSKYLLFRRTAHIRSDVIAKMSPAAQYYTEVLLPYIFPNEDSKLFVPSSSNDTINLSNILKKEFRCSHDGDGGDNATSTIASHKKYPITERLDAAFACIRKLSCVLKAYKAMGSDDDEVNKKKMRMIF